MKKLFALLLAVIMVISMAACQANEPKTTTAPSGSQPADPTNGPTTPTANDDWSSKDLTGIVEDDVIKIGIQMTATVTDYDDNKLTEYLEELTGLDIQFVFFSSDGSEARQQFALMVANREPLPDVLFGVLSDKQVAEYGQDGLIADQTEWINKAYNFGRYMEIMTDYEKDYLFSRLKNGTTGEIYTYPAYQFKDDTCDNCEYLGGISTTMAKKFGMDAAEIDTIDEVYQFLTKVVKEDGNGNGEADDIGFFYRPGGYRTNAVLWIINAYIYCNDTYMFNVEDGKLYLPYNTDEYRQALITLNKWYSEGLITPLSYTVANNAEAKALIDVGPGNYKIGIWGYHPTLCCDANSQIDADYTYLRILKDETGKGGYASLRDRYTLGRNASIPVNEEKPERMELAFRFCDLFADWEVQHRLRYGVEGVNWEYVDGEKEGIKDNQGNWAGWKLIHDTWSEASNDTWHTCPIGVKSEFSVKEGVSRGGQPAVDRTGTRGAISYGLLAHMEESKMPDEYVYDLVYNEEETEIMSQYKGAYIGHVTSTRAKFITGVLDPNNDADWATYLDELKKEGQEDILEAAQDAYDRMYN